MSGRPQRLQQFLDDVIAAFDGLARDTRSRRSIAVVSHRLARPGEIRPGTGRRLPVCALLPDLLTRARFAGPPLAALADSFAALEPDLFWSCRPGPSPKASESFADGHANAQIVGPAGLEQRRDIQLGISLLAPHVRYPDHDHPPEESYLVLTPGRFRQEEGPWFEPGVGGSFYNKPGITHAMHSGADPLLAFWLLRSEAT